MVKEVEAESSGTAKKTGRPTVYCEKLVELLFDEICNGSSIKHACETASLDTRTFYRWLGSNEAFAARITRAREVQQEALIDEMREIADSANEDNWQAKRLQIWQRQWCAARLHPRKYGDRIAVEGGKGDTQINFFVARIGDGVKDAGGQGKAIGDSANGESSDAAIEVQVEEKT